MGTYVASDGEPFEVVHSDRGYGGRRRTALLVDGRTGDVAVTGRLLLNGVAVTTGGTQGIQGPTGPTGPASSTTQNDHFTPTSGQTHFLLTQTPVSEVEMFVNGARQKLTADFTVSVRNVTWLNNGFQLAPSDDVVFTYQR